MVFLSFGCGLAKRVIALATVKDGPENIVVVVAICLEGSVS